MKLTFRNQIANIKLLPFSWRNPLSCGTIIWKKSDSIPEKSLIHPSSPHGGTAAARLTLCTMGGVLDIPPRLHYKRCLCCQPIRRLLWWRCKLRLVDRKIPAISLTPPFLPLFAISPDSLNFLVNWAMMGVLRGMACKVLVIYAPKSQLMAL